MLRLLKLSLLSALLFSTSALPIDLPVEIKAFTSRGMKPIVLKTADLNGDGLNDYLLILEDADGNRLLRILTKQIDGKFLLAKQSANAIMCRSCGGVLGDPFLDMHAKARSFTLNHAGGSADRWSSSFTFNYSRRDDTWQLVLAEERSYSSTAPNRAHIQRYVPPKDFGKIAIEEFDPENYLGQGQH